MCHIMMCSINIRLKINLNNCNKDIHIPTLAPSHTILLAKLFLDRGTLTLNGV